MIIYRRRRCTHCNGKRTIERFTINSNIPYTNRCPTCNGTGTEVKGHKKRQRR